MAADGSLSGRGRTAVVGLALLLAALAVFLVRGEYRARTEIVEATLVADDRLRLSVATCDGDPAVDEVSEVDDEVRIAVTGTHYLWVGDDCLDQLEVGLDAALADRRVVDVETGATVEVVDEAG